MEPHKVAGRSIAKHTILGYDFDHLQVPNNPKKRLKISAMKRSPLASTATAVGPLRLYWFVLTVVLVDAPGEWVV